MALFLSTGELLLSGGGPVITAPYQQCTAFEQFRAQLIERVGEDINASSLLTGNLALQPQTGGILNISANHQCIFTLLFTCQSRTDRDVVDQYAAEDCQQRLENRLLALKPSTQRDKQMCGECLGGVILTTPLDPRSQAMRITIPQMSQ